LYFFMRTRYEITTIIQDSKMCDSCKVQKVVTNQVFVSEVVRGDCSGDVRCRCDACGENTGERSTESGLRFCPPTKRDCFAGNNSPKICCRGTKTTNACKKKGCGSNNDPAPCCPPKQSASHAAEHADDHAH
jgi:hypothetical protein